MKTRDIDCELRTQASVQDLWSAWTDPQRLAQWFADRATGEAKPGSALTLFFDAFGYELPWPVIEVMQGEKVVFGGQFGDRPPWRLEITLRREGGESVLRLHNSGFLSGAEWDDEYEGVASGWQLSLALLREYAERHLGQPKRTLMTLRPAAFDFATVLRWFTDDELRRRWLPDGVRGRVLATSRQEQAVTWQEQGAVLEFKALGSRPGARSIGLRATAWGDAAERLAGAQQKLDEWTDRLAAQLR